MNKKEERIKEVKKMLESMGIRRPTPEEWKEMNKLDPRFATEEELEAEREREMEN